MKNFYSQINWAIFGACFIFCGCGADKSVEMEEGKLSSETSAILIKEKKPKNNLLNAPANYIKTSVGQIKKAKKAAAVYEKSSNRHMNIPEEDGQ